ncbi:unnamed protein product, partial [marine sediment metagenome]
KYLQCGIEVADTIGNKYSYGGIAQYLERLENGTDFDGNDIVHTVWTGNQPIGDTISSLSVIKSIGISCVSKNTTTNTVAVSYYRDGNSTADATFTLAPQNSDGTIATPTSQDASIEGGSIFHSLKMVMTTDDETIGFEPLYLYAYYKLKRRKLLGGS